MDEFDLYGDLELGSLGTGPSSAPKPSACIIPHVAKVDLAAADAVQPTSNCTSAVLAFQDSELKRLQKLILELQDEVSESKQLQAQAATEAKTLQEQRTTLIHNISVLFRTAVCEIDRKNKDIQDLRAQLATHSTTTTTHQRRLDRRPYDGHLPPRQYRDALPPPPPLLVLPAPAAAMGTSLPASPAQLALPAPPPTDAPALPQHAGAVQHSVQHGAQLPQPPRGGVAVSASQDEPRPAARTSGGAGARSRSRSPEARQQHVRPGRRSGGEPGPYLPDSRRPTDGARGRDHAAEHSGRVSGGDGRGREGAPDHTRRSVDVRRGRDSGGDHSRRPSGEGRGRDTGNEHGRRSADEGRGRDSAAGEHSRRSGEDKRSRSTASPERRQPEKRRRQDEAEAEDGELPAAGRNNSGAVARGVDTGRKPGGREAGELSAAGRISGGTRGAEAGRQSGGADTDGRADRQNVRLCTGSSGSEQARRDSGKGEGGRGVPWGADAASWRGGERVEQGGKRGSGGAKRPRSRSPLRDANGRQNAAQVN